MSINDGFKNGGMPSSHSTIVSALTMAILLKEGFSTAFFIAVVFSSIIISDAFRIRRNVGMQGEQLNILLKKSKEKTIDIVYGHTPSQVFAGIILGIIVSVAVFFVI
jgi:acid phosphatase family membrane protein YuiD